MPLGPSESSTPIAYRPGAPRQPADYLGMRYTLPFGSPDTTFRQIPNLWDAGVGTDLTFDVFRKSRKIQVEIAWIMTKIEECNHCVQDAMRALNHHFMTQDRLATFFVLGDILVLYDENYDLEMGKPKDIPKDKTKEFMVYEEHDKHIVFIGRLEELFKQHDSDDEAVRKDLSKETCKDPSDRWDHIIPEVRRARKTLKSVRKRRGEEGR